LDPDLFDPGTQPDPGTHGFDPTQRQHYSVSAPIRGHAGGLASTNYRGVHRQRARDKLAGALSSRHGVAPAQSSQLDWGQRGGPILQGCAMPRFSYSSILECFSVEDYASCLGSRTYGQLGKLQRECHPASVKIPAVPFPPFEGNGGGVVDVNVKAPRTRRGPKKRTKANSPRFNQSALWYTMRRGPFASTFRQLVNGGFGTID
jgi:hypothetical protein